MALLQASRKEMTLDLPQRSRHPWLRSVALGALLLVSLVFSYRLAQAAPPDSIFNIPPSPRFLSIWMLSFLPYVASCLLLLVTKPGQGRWRWIEVGIILAGALCLRLVLLPLPPELSRDSWRYLWDARVTLHGFSPYVYRPVDPALKSLIDNVLFLRMRYRTAPTIYPPGAQAVFLLSYLLAGPNLYALKALFMLFDLGTCGVLLLFLSRKRLDLGRVLIYAWCPLPIVEFAMQGHVDVITLTFSILALLSFANESVGGRILSGFLIAMAALTKIYPILLLIVVVPDMVRSAQARGRWFQLRARDLALFASCLLTIVLGYLPYYILGNGQVLGYFALYANQQGPDAGIVQLLLQWAHVSQNATGLLAVVQTHLLSLGLVAIVSFISFLLLLREQISKEAALLLLFGTILAISTHVFPWYTGALLLWVPLLVDPPRAGHRLSGKMLVITGVWLFVCISPLSYFYTPIAGQPFPDWTPYYQAAYLPLATLCIAATIIGLVHHIPGLQKEKLRANHS